MGEIATSPKWWKPSTLFSWCKQKSQGTGANTVDGRNPAPVDSLTVTMLNLSFTEFYTSQEIGLGISEPSTVVSNSSNMIFSSTACSSLKKKNSQGPRGQISQTHLGGGFKYFFFHPYLGKIPILTNIFQMGWNHQPVILIHQISIFPALIRGEHHSGRNSSFEVETSSGKALLRRWARWLVVARKCLFFFRLCQRYGDVFQYYGGWFQTTKRNKKYVGKTHEQWTNPGWLFFFLDYTTQLCGDYKRIPIKQPV